MNRKILLSIRVIIFYTIIISIVFQLASCKKSTSQNSITDSHFSEFESKWFLYNESSYGGWKNNFQGRFSWDDSYALEGLILNFERSNDKRYLDTFVKAASKIINLADINLGLKDNYRGNRILHGWSTTRYTLDSSYHIFGVTNAMILYPIIKMYNIANKNVLLSNSDKLFFENALKFSILEFNEIHINDWVINTATTGYFQDPYYSSIGITTPVNQYARIGTYAIELFKATGQDIYLRYAQKIAQLIKDNLIFNSDYFYWNYTISFPKSQNDAPEDLGHSILVIQFIVSCFKNKIVFNDLDITQLVNLFKKQIRVANSNYFHEYLNGNIISKDPYISHYYLLSEFDHSVYDILSNWYDQQAFQLDRSSFLNHFGNKLILLDALNMYYKK